MLREALGPVDRRGDQDEKYSLDCEEAKKPARLRADRHFPLNIQETGVNKRSTGRTISPVAELRITEFQRKSEWWEVMLDGGCRPVERAGGGRGLAAEEPRIREMKMLWLLLLPVCALAAVLPPSSPPPPRTFASLLSHSPQSNTHGVTLPAAGVERALPDFQNKTTDRRRP